MTEIKNVKLIRMPFVEPCRCGKRQLEPGERVIINDYQHASVSYSGPAAFCGPRVNADLAEWEALAKKYEWFLGELWLHCGCMAHLIWEVERTQDRCPWCRATWSEDHLSDCPRRFILENYEKLKKQYVDLPQL